MGRPKQLILYDGMPLVARAADAALEAGAKPVIVVLGAHAPDVQAALMHLAGITVVVNPDWATGLASSLTAGLRASLTTQCEGVLVTLADQPHVDAVVLAQLIAKFRSGARIVAAGYDGSPGVPALFGCEHIASLLDLNGDAGAGAWLRERRHEVAVMPFDGVLLDLDTPSDME